MARPLKSPAMKMGVDLRIPMTAAQKRLVFEAAASDQSDVATWVRPILVRAAQDRLATQADRRNLSAAPAWIEQSIEFEKSGKGEEALDVIFDNIDELLLSSKYKQCSSVLASLPVDRLSNAQLLTALTASSAARDRLSGRKVLYSRVEKILALRGTDVSRLLLGL